MPEAPSQQFGSNNETALTRLRDAHTQTEQLITQTEQKIRSESNEAKRQQLINDLAELQKMKGGLEEDIAAIQQLVEQTRQATITPEVQRSPTSSLQERLESAERQRNEAQSLLESASPQQRQEILPILQSIEEDIAAIKNEISSFAPQERRFRQNQEQITQLQREVRQTQQELEQGRMTAEGYRILREDPSFGLLSQRIQTAQRRYEYLRRHPDIVSPQVLSQLAQLWKQYQTSLIPQNQLIQGRQEARYSFPRNAESLGKTIFAVKSIESVLQQSIPENVLQAADGIEQISERSFLAALDSNVTLKIQHNGSSYVDTITLDARPGATYTSGTQDLNIRRTQQGWEITMKPTFTGTMSIDRNQGRGAQAFTIGEHPAVSVGSPTQQVRQTPAQPQQVRPAQPREAERAPRPTVAQPAETVRETAEGFSVSADRKIYIRNTQTNQTNYLEPHFQYRQLWLHGYAVARRSNDNRRWTITPTPNQSGDIVYSLDGRTWQRLGQERQVQQQPQPREPEERRTQPVTPEVPSEQEFITLPDGSKLPKLRERNKNVRRPSIPVEQPLPETVIKGGTTEQPPAETVRPPTPLRSARENPPSAQPERRIGTPRSSREQTTASTEIRADVLRNAYFNMMKRYESSIAKDYAKYGGSTEWKTFDHRYHQLQFDIDYCFDGNTPEFVELQSWQRLLSSQDRIQVQEALKKTSQLFDEYDAATLPEKAPDSIQEIDTLRGDEGTLLQSIEKYRQQILQSSSSSMKKIFIEKNALFIEAYSKAKTSALKKAVLVCHEAFARNIANARTSPSASFNASSFLTTLTSGAQFLTAGNDEMSFRKGLITQANETPMEMELSSKQLLQLIKIKQEMDSLRMKKNISARERYDEMIRIIGDNSDVLEYLSEKSDEKLNGTKMIGWKVSPQMKGVFNAETIDWLVANYVSSTPFNGLADSSFFYIEPVQKQESTAATKTPTTSSEPETRQSPSDALPNFNNLGENIFENLGLNFGKKKENSNDEIPGRKLSQDEIIALGFRINVGEEIKEVSPGKYIACSEGTCREIVFLKKEPSTQEVAPAPRQQISESRPETQPVSPQIPEGISMNQERREFRLPSNEEFIVTYDPPVSGAIKAEFGPNLNTSFDGIVIKAERGATEWIVRIVPTYEGTVTLRRSRDNATMSLVVQKQVQKKERLATQPTTQPTSQPQVSEHVPTGQVEHIQSEVDFTERVLQSPVPVIVDFSAGWCGHCKRMAPIVQEIARERSSSIRVVELDVDELRGIFERYAPVDNRGQRSLPTLVVFDNGKVHTSATGFRQKTQIESMIPRSKQIAQNR